jgi:hypothetical protein
MRILALSIVIILGSATPTSAQQTMSPVEDDSSGDIIISAALDPATCNTGNSTPIAFNEALAVENSSSTQCVRVEGFRLGRALFLNAADARLKNSEASKKLAARRIGIYGSERVLAHAPTRPRLYTVVGQLHRCETAWPGAMLVMGYCHYSGGPFLLASQTFPSPVK